MLTERNYHIKPQYVVNFKNRIFFLKFYKNLQEFRIFCKTKIPTLRKNIEVGDTEERFDFGKSFCLKKSYFDFLTEKMIDYPIEWFQNKTLELENEFKRKGALLEIKSMVLNSEKKVLNDIVHNVSINPIFDCLKGCDEQDMEDICTVLYALLTEMTASRLLEVYGESIHRCLAHNSNGVKRTALKLIEKSVDDKTIETLFNRHAPLIMDAVTCIASEDRGTAQGAISLLTKIGNSGTGLSALFSHAVLNKLKEIMTVNDITRFRVYEIVVAVSKFSADNLSKSISSGLMEQLLSEISSSDILVQLNALELLSSLAASNHGLNYLQEHKVIQNLVEKVLKLNEEPLSVMLLPGMIEFFGNICVSQPDYFTSEYPQIMNLLFNNVDTNDEVLLGVIIITVGKIGSSSAGRLALEKYRDHMNHFFQKIGQILKTKNDIAISAMNSLCELIKNINGDVKVNKISCHWFQSITPNALDSITTISKLPFVEFRLAALAVLKALASQDWGTEKLTNHPGMIEFLTDRSTEFNKDCKETKYGIVFNMMQCSIIEKLVTQQVLHNLREFVREGPFYVPANVEMATEGAT